MPDSASSANEPDITDGSAPADVVSGTANTSDTSEASAELLTTPNQRNGIWVYSPNSWIDDTSKVNAFLSAMLKKGVKDIYLSANYALLEDPALPAFIARLTNNGMSAEALMGKVEWGTNAGRSDLDTHLDRVLEYNQGQPYASRFKAIHLDIEPWIGTGSNTSWVSPLISALNHSRTHIDGRIKLSGDLAGSKVVNLSKTERLAFATALDKTVLMQYEATTTAVLDRTNRFMSGLNLTSAHPVVIAMRNVDFSSSLLNTALLAIQGEFSGSTGYLGWALYHYSDIK